MVGSLTPQRLASTALVATLGLFVHLAVAPAEAQEAAARPRCELVLPAATRAFVSVDNTADLMTRWKHTRIGELISGPLMNPFVDEVYQRLQEVWLEGHQRLGIDWADVRDVPTGQVALGYVHEAEQRPAIVLWMDVKGNVQAADTLLDKIRGNLIDQGAQREEVEYKGVKMVVYTVPPREGSRRNDKAVHFTKDDVLVVAGGVPLAQKLLDRWDGSASDSVGKSEPFLAVMKRCQLAAGDMAPQLRWFIDPFPLVDALKETAPPADPNAAKQIDLLVALRNQGFDAVTGIGGFVHLDEGPVDVLHRTAVYAPGARHDAMALLALPNAALGKLPSWVGDKVTSANLLNIDAKADFEMVGKMVDELLAQTELGEDAHGFFDATLEDFKDNQFFNPVDIRKEVIDNLGSRAVLITDYSTPITADSQRALLAIETKNSEPIAKALEKLFGGDDTYLAQKIGDATVWESIGEKAETTGDVVKDDSFSVPPLNFSVAHGYLFVSTNADIIKETLEGADHGPRLGDAEDFAQVTAILDKLGADETCFRGFTRTDEANRVTYELIRQNRLHEATSPLGSLANLLLENGSKDKDAAKADVVDGSKLPSYDVVREYIGPSGMFAVTEKDGWFSTGFILSKGKEAATAEKAAGEKDGAKGDSAAEKEADAK